MKKLHKYPTISVVIATHNSARTIGRCLEAIRSQKYPQKKIDIIISDGGSTDNTRDICEKYNVRWISVDIHKQNAEYNKAIGISKAKGTFLFLLDHDNIICHDDWLIHMLQPLLSDNKIIASETLRYAYDPNASLVDRYFGLFGAGDPLAFYLGKTDRLSYMFDTYNLMGFAQEYHDYYKVIFAPGEIPTLGANGYIVRRKILMKNSGADPDHFFHIDVNVDLIKNGFNTYAFVKEDILHLTGYASVWSFLKRRILFMRQYHMGSSGLSAQSLRRYSVYEPGDIWKLAWFVFISLTGIIPLFDSIRGYRKIRDSAWFLHPFLCWCIVILYSWVVITHLMYQYGKKLLAK
jgi:glycosyltransferase involved in cell wall biosynthesis